MRALLQDVWDHLREDYDPVIYGGVAAVCTALLVSHYVLGVISWGPAAARPWWHLGPFVLLYAVPYSLIVGLLWARGRATPPPKFYLAAAVGLVALGSISWWPFHSSLMRQLPKLVQPLFSSVVWNLKSCLLYLVPIGVFWALFDREHRPFYGWNFAVMDLKAYRGAALGLVALACLASFHESFRIYYPTYQPGRSEIYLGIPAWVGFVINEAVYGVQFACVETFFRGFFVVGMARWLGRGAVLPMVAIYCTLHLGKPFGEAFTSIFGGYCLGVWAYKNRCMIEGIMLHLALAWAMDTAAYLQFLVRR